MRQFVVRAVPGATSPRFRSPEGKEWWDGDAISEEDLLGIYGADVVDVLVEAGALEIVPSR